MEREKTSCSQNRNSPITFNNLKFVKCVFLTNQQLNVKEIHKPKNSLVIERKIFANNSIDIERTINQIIDDIYLKLNEVYKKNVKIPFPIFAMIGRELEIDSNLFEGESFTPIPLTPSPTLKYGNTEINKTGGTIAIIDYIKGFFKSGLSTNDDIKKYEGSLINSYKFKGNVRIFLYVPYLNNEYRYISNFRDICNSIYFFYTVINSSFYMNIERTSTFNAKKYREQLEKARLPKQTIDLLVNINVNIDKKKYFLYDDLRNLCFDGGCVANSGEDFDTLLPPFTSDDETNNKNATDKSPFMPNKCISKTNGFLCNVRFASGNTDIHPFIKNNNMKEISENLSSYTKLVDKIERNQELTEDESKYVSKYSSPINLITSIINEFIKKYYSNNLNDDKKDDIKLNHYSKNYSENVIKELAYLKKLNGVPEFVMSLYLFKEEMKKDKIVYMPFGKSFPSKMNVFNFGDELMVDEVLYSFNNRYGMKLNVNGFVPVFEVSSKRILYYLNKTFISKPVKMTVQENGLLITFENDEGNIVNRNYLFNLSSLVDNCETCLPPFSLILNDNGNIRIYGNGFFDATSKEFNKFLNNEREIASRVQELTEMRRREGQEKEEIPLSIDDLNNVSTSINFNQEIIRQEPYLWCSPNSRDCRT